MVTSKFWLADDMYHAFVHPLHADFEKSCGYGIVKPSHLHSEGIFMSYWYPEPSLMLFSTVITQPLKRSERSVKPPNGAPGRSFS